MTATAAPANSPYFARTSLNLHSIFPHFLHSCDRGDSKKSITLGKHARTRAYTHTHIHTRTREPRTRTRAYIHTHERTSKVKLTSKHKKRTNQQRLLTRCSYNQFGSLNKNSPRPNSATCTFHFAQQHIFFCRFSSIFSLFGVISRYIQIEGITENARSNFIPLSRRKPLQYTQPYTRRIPTLPRLYPNHHRLLFSSWFSNPNRPLGPEQIWVENKMKSFCRSTFDH